MCKQTVLGCSVNMLERWHERKSGCNIWRDIKNVTPIFFKSRSLRRLLQFFLAVPFKTETHYLCLDSESHSVLPAADQHSTHFLPQVESQYNLCSSRAVKCASACGLSSPPAMLMSSLANELCMPISGWSWRVSKRRCKSRSCWHSDKRLLP